MKNRRIRKLLIANRGEIALRIQRSALDLGLETVAIFSDADQCAPHVLRATEAYPLRGNRSTDTYLNVGKIIDIAKAARCDAIHPGYGFLSENAEFADAVTAAGLIFIGPPSAAMKAMGGKTEARALMAHAEVPIIPGTTCPLSDYTDACNVARRVGYPVLIKAIHGGGGKGMRKVSAESEMERSFNQAKSESLSSFGSGEIYIEKYLRSPRHIEIQILADMHGNVVHLGERECSVQRRHQKVVEECPSVALTKELREQMGRAAVNAAQTCDYVNAGTVEFMLEEDGSFYFLEMNTRLQVEHPVTEMVYGVDLVKTQIRIAEGESLDLRQEDIAPRGHAIECRIYAEDPFNGFLPSTGEIADYTPSEGFGIRHDSGVSGGSKVVHFYDPLLSKLIAWGIDRPEALKRMKRALEEFKISGVSTTVPFCWFVVTHPKFIEGKYDIHFVEKHFKTQNPSFTEEEELVASLAAASMHRWTNGEVAVSDDKIPVQGKWKTKRFAE